MRLGRFSIFHHDYSSPKDTWDYHNHMKKNFQPHAPCCGHKETLAGQSRDRQKAQKNIRKEDTEKLELECSEEVSLMLFLVGEQGNFV